MSTVTQETFVDNFLQLLSAKSNGIVYNDDYKEDLSKLQQLPIAFPKPPAKKTLFTNDARKTGSGKQEKYKLKFKSIKPPYKFAAEFVSEATNTIYQVKDQLIENVKKQFTDDDKYTTLSSAQVKLLVKSKVPQDSIQFQDLQGVKNNEVSFMVMVNSKPSAPPSQEQTPEPDIEKVVPATKKEPESQLSLSESTWAGIRKLLIEELGSTNAEVAAKRLKKGWDLAK